MDADGLETSLRPGGVTPRDVTAANRIEDRGGERGLRTGLETPVLQGSKCAGVRFRGGGKDAIVGRLLSSCPNGVNLVDLVLAQSEKTFSHRLALSY